MSMENMPPCVKCKFWSPDDEHKISGWCHHHQILADSYESCESHKPVITSKVMTSITDAAVIENQKARLDLLKRMDRRVRELETALQQLKEILAVPASNRQMMQIAGPARRCLNIIKSTETLNYTEEVERLTKELQP